MFTGIVHNQFMIASIAKEEGLTRLELELGPYAEGLTQGASVSIAGVCLTAVQFSPTGKVWFDVIAETLARTTLGTLQVGERVNIERAAKFGDEIGGHDVSGHVTGVGEVIGVNSPTNNRVLTLRVEPSLMRYIFHKGYIALDGASLTVASVERGEGTFEVHLIPETLTRTTFGGRKVGDLINVEVDPRTVAVVDTTYNVIDAIVEARLNERER